MISCWDNGIKILVSLDLCTFHRFPYKKGEPAPAEAIIFIILCVDVVTVKRMDLSDGAYLFWSNYMARNIYSLIWHRLADYNNYIHLSKRAIFDGHERKLIFTN